MSRTRGILTIVALGLFVVPLAAEEILHFKSGTSMPVVSHRVEGEMVHVDLGDNGFVAFPLANIDRIETAGQHVMLKQSTQRASGSSVMRVAPSPEGDFPVQAQSQGKRKDRGRFDGQDQDFDPAIEIDERGVAAYRPMATSSQAAKRQLAFTGNRRVRHNTGTPGALRGARQVGTKQVIGPVGPRRSNNQSKIPVGSPEFQKKTGGGASGAAPTGGSSPTPTGDSGTPTQSGSN